MCAQEVDPGLDPPNPDEAPFVLPLPPSLQQSLFWAQIELLCMYVCIASRQDIGHAVFVAYFT